MSEDYLWDRTGEPDPEIERLEQVLSSLRYQPQPFAIPADVQGRRRRRVIPMLAIAATIAMMIVGTGLWLGLRRPLNRESTFVPAKATATPFTGSEVFHKDEQTRVLPRLKSLKRRTIIAANRERKLRMLAGEREEAKAAKQQIMLALRLASAKVNLAQKKAQGAPTIIRNQHKAG